ncbi:hypothetical protein [Haliangium sp.]|uniref:hypothetical protein n=1 Tax=Haliangium sp. TaxID=2663208 RepID=UPI003D09823B
MFINACFACTGQREFYSDAAGQRVSIDFLHRYILGNYRRLYARTLAAGINHFNQAQIILNLLATGRDTPARDRPEENALITRALAALPPQRAYRLFEALRDRRVNNRRTRALIRAYVGARRDLVFDAVKYRSRLRTAAAHAHLGLAGEIGSFLFQGLNKRRFSTELLETYRQAHFSKDAVYRLPYTIAEGLAVKHRIPRDQFLAGIADRMTAGEKLRLQREAARREVALDFDLARAALTRLCIYITALAPAERKHRADELSDALDRSAARAFRRTPYRLGRVAAVLDRSYSSSGTSDKRRRPLAVAMAGAYLLRHAASEFRALWTPRIDPDLAGAAGADAHFMATPGGQTELARPLLEALKWSPELVVIISDGYENTPPGATTQLVRAFRDRVPGAGAISIVHLNPVFDVDHFAPKALGPDLPTVGIRDAEDLLTMLGFARFAEGSAPLHELEGYLGARTAQLLADDGPQLPADDGGRPPADDGGRS